MIDLNYKPKNQKPNDGFDGIPLGAVCGMIATGWTVLCLLAKLIGIL